MSVDINHPEYERLIQLYKIVCDSIEGEDKIKEGCEEYLPKACGHSCETYIPYKGRASYTEILSSTINAWKGLIFRKPVQYGNVINDELINGYSLSLANVTNQVVDGLITYGRYGLMAEYDNDLSRAIMIAYNPERIVNWKYDKNGNLVLVVLEQELPSEDEFEHENILQRLVLRLVDGVYTQQVYIRVNGGWEAEDEFEPTINGAKLGFIPFTFLDINKNNCGIGKPPLLPLARKAIKDYQVSADYYSALYTTAQSTLYIKGALDVLERNRDLHGNALKDDEPMEINVGSDSVLFLGNDGEAGYAETSGNGIDAMRQARVDLKDEMLALGAKVLNQAQAQVTAKTAEIQESSHTSILHGVVKVAEEEILKVLRWIAEWNRDNSKIEFNINDEFFSPNLEPAQFRELLNAYLQGVLTQEQLFDELRHGGLKSFQNRTNEEIKEQLENDGLNSEVL